jgi:hypothetical protein
MVCQENGTIAEARTRAFLVDRFWVLERSADVEGADFIIQRRITQTSLLDKTPPRLGFIQVKFFASEATTQYVHREYVVDADGEPRSEFFVMSQTGNRFTIIFAARMRSTPSRCSMRYRAKAFLRANSKLVIAARR